MKFLLITNNPIVERTYEDAVIVKGSLLDVLTKTRNYIHLGHSLLMHPLPGSVKPNETPYRSILMSKDAIVGKTDLRSVELIENAIYTQNKFPSIKHEYSEAVRYDFQIIDLEFIKSALESL